MKPLICKQCGAPIDPHTYTCKSCGVSYEKPPVHVHEVVAEDPRFATVCASCEISDMMLYGSGNTSEVVDLAVKEITHQLAEAIIPFTEYRVSRFSADPLRQTRVIQGSVRVKRLEHSDLGHRHFINEMLNLPDEEE